MKPLILVAAVAALGAVATTLYVGTRVREDTVVQRPYEEGLAYDAERHGREAAGFAVAVEAAPPAGQRGALAFDLRDRAGRPVEGATVALLVARPDTGHGQFAATAAAAGGGRYAADLAFPEPGPWEVRFDIQHGAERARLARTVSVPAAAAVCDAAGGPCTLAVGAGVELTLDVGPRPLRTMTDLAVRAELRRAGAPLDGATVRARFLMPGMEMGRNEVTLAPAGAGRYAGTAVLVRCPSGRKTWAADVEVAIRGEPARRQAVAITVAE